MTWTRLSDDFTDTPAMLKVSRSARLLHIEVLIWCNRMLTDGLVPTAALRRLTDSETLSADIEQLVAAGLWSSHEDGWRVDWTDQEKAEEVRARQAYVAEKQKRYRRRKSAHERGSHEDCDSRYCKGTVTGNAPSNVTGLVTPSRPVPSRPKDRGQGQGAVARSATATRAPRLAAGDSTGTAPTLLNPSPWDIRVYLNNYGDSHHEIVARPLLDREDCEGYSIGDIEAGYAYFGRVAAVVADSVREAIETLTETHDCSHDMEDGCSFGDFTAENEPSFNVTVPAAVSGAWLHRITAGFTKALKREEAA